MTDRCLYGMEHDFTSIAFAPLCGDDTANGDFLHVGACRTYTGQGYYPPLNSHPEVDGLLVVAIKVLVDAVLLHHKHLATHPEEFVEFSQGQLVKCFLVDFRHFY